MSAETERRDALNDFLAALQLAMGAETERRDALNDFLAALQLAMHTYTSTGAMIALTFGNKNLGGDSAVDLIARGETERVMEWLRSLTGMVAT